MADDVTQPAPDPDGPAPGFPATTPEPPDVPGLYDPAPEPAPEPEPPVIPGLTAPIDS